MAINQDICEHNYMDTFYLCHVGRDKICEKMVVEHTLVYVLSGEMDVILPDGSKVNFRRGDTAFLRRNHKVSKEKHPSANGEPFEAFFLHLNGDFLRRFRKNNHIVVPVANGLRITRQTVFRLENHPFLKALFLSLGDYFQADTYPSKELMESKLREAVYVLLQLRPELTPVLFDFVDQWKIDIKQFMEDNFLSDLSVEQFAHYTGRSLTSFKQDFNKIFNITPQRWLTKRRLQEARRLMEQTGESASEVYLKAGFKNLSHFSTAFKKEFGFSPSQLALKVG